MAVSSANALALALSIAYCTIATGVSEIVRRRRGYGGEFTRKFVHVSIGLWIIPTLFLFKSWYWAAALPALAIAANSLSYKFQILRGIERGVKGDLGTIYFPISFVWCIAAFFDSAFPVAAAAGIMPMALGDAAAAIVGNALGRHPYVFFGARKSVEGSIAMAVVTALSLFATLTIFRIPMGPALVISLVLAPVATVLEAAGKKGLDNLTVPVVCSVAAFFMLKVTLGGHA
jgi:phytol kinase